MASEPVILIVDRNQKNLELLTQFLTKEGYAPRSASSLEEVEAVLPDAQNIVLALIDISGFSAAIWQYCARLSDEGVLLLILSPKQSATIQQESIAHGARGVLVKPLVMKDLSALIRNMMR